MRSPTSGVSRLQKGASESLSCRSVTTSPEWSESGTFLLSETAISDPALPPRSLKKLRKALSQLYRNRFLQINSHLETFSNYKLLLPLSFLRNVMEVRQNSMQTLKYFFCKNQESSMFKNNELGIEHMKFFSFFFFSLSVFLRSL